MDINKSMVIRAVGEEAVRRAVRSAGPVMIPRLEGGGLRAAVPGVQSWMSVLVRAKDGVPEAECKCGVQARYCSHAIEVMVYAATHMDRLRAAREAEDAGISEAAGRALPPQKKVLAKAASDKGSRYGLHLLQIPPHKLPPRGLNYENILDMMYMESSYECHVGDNEVDFVEITDVAEAFIDCGDVEEALRIYRAVAETIAKNAGIVDNEYYSISLDNALHCIEACMNGPKGRSKHETPDGARKRCIQWLAGRVARDDPDYFTSMFAAALDSVCSSKEDKAWRKQESRFPA